MPTFIAGMLALYLVLSAIKRFGRVTPAEAAKLLRKGGPAVSFLSVALMLFRGPLGLVGALLGLFAPKLNRPGGFSGGGAAFQSAFRDVGSGPGKSRISTARSATLEMRLDLDNGAISGDVISGLFAGRSLDSLNDSQCLTLLQACRGSDPEGATLLETYLDRRRPGWREADEGEAQGRGGGAPGGAISRDEAYEILGLPKGAGAEEIVRAHRSLMKKLHPDHGGSTALAARVNQAKDVLLSRHG